MDPKDWRVECLEIIKKNKLMTPKTSLLLIVAISLMIIGVVFLLITEFHGGKPEFLNTIGQLIGGAGLAVFFVFGLFVFANYHQTISSLPKLYCPQCEKYVPHNLAWKCPFCDKEYIKNSQRISIFEPCNQCQKDPGIYRCPFCGHGFVVNPNETSNKEKIIYSEEKVDEILKIRPIDFQNRRPIEITRLKEKEGLTHDIEKTRLEIEKAEAEKKLRALKNEQEDVRRRRREARNQLLANIEDDITDVREIRKLFDRLKKEVEEDFKDDPDKRAKELKELDQLFVQAVLKKR